MPQKKRKIWPWLLFILITMGAAGAYYYFKVYKKDQNENLEWNTVSVKRKDIKTSVLATGIIKPKVGAEVRVGSRASGIVKRLYVSVGDQVKKGQLLAELDATELKARYNQAMASLEKSKSDKEYSKINLDRHTKLNDKNFASKDKVDLARNDFEIAQAQVKLQEANLEFAQVQLEYTRITAPISGVVASVSTQEGETVAASFAAPTFVTILDLNRLEIWAYVDETDIGRIEKGQKVTFSVDTYTDTDFEGTVEAIYPKAEMKDNVVNYITIIEIDSDKGKILRPDMTTTVNIHLKTRENVVVVPNKGIHRESGKKYVHLLLEEKPVKQFIKTGMKDKFYTEILEGLDEGQLVILDDV